MSTFWRLTKKDYYSAAHDIKKILPELENKVDTDTVYDRLRFCTNFEFYDKEKAPVKLWIRFTIPFALITIVLFLIFTPINFMITGHWGYKFIWLKNWLAQLRLA